MSLLTDLKGLAVFVKRGARTGQVGVLSGVDNLTMEVQFGTDGPFVSYNEGMLRPATLAEVTASGLRGVSGLKILQED